MVSPKPLLRLAAAIAPLVALPTASAEDGPTAAARQAAVNAAVEKGESLWRQIAKGEMRPTLTCRWLVGYALTLCEAREHPDRVKQLLALARRMQDQDPKSKNWGNLRWYWRDADVTDANAVEFVMHDALLIDIRHRDWLPEKARAELAEFLRLGIEGCRRHRVPSDYTNIAILNAANLLVLGERLNRTDAAEEGYRRLDAICCLTAVLGVHEFCSPTYYGTDLNGLLMVRCYARQRAAARAGRRLAAALLDRHRRQLVPRREAARRLPQPQLRLSPRAGSARLAFLGPRLAGRRSSGRRGAGGAVERPMEPAAAIGRDGPAAASPPGPPALGIPARRGPHADDLSGRCPVVLRRRLREPGFDAGGGPVPAKGTVPFSLGQKSGQSPRDLPRCYFIADGRDDPYGKSKVATGAAQHLKSLHMQPFWAGRSGRRTRWAW